MARKLNFVSLFSWAILVAAIVVSFRPLTPVIWDDPPAFVESALRTLETRRPTVVGGRDPGYPTFLAMTFAVGGDLSSAVLVQEAAWAALMIALATTAQMVTRSPYSLGPIILVAMLLMYRNIILAETLYTVFLNLAVLALVLATTVKNPIQCWTVAALIATFLASLSLKTFRYPMILSRSKRREFSLALRLVSISRAQGHSILHVKQSLPMWSVAADQQNLASYSCEI
jgi:hypothetical protein